MPVSETGSVIVWRVTPAAAEAVEAVVATTASANAIVIATKRASFCIFPPLTAPIGTDPQ
jgi:hypothetical protein